VTRSGVRVGVDVGSVRVGVAASDPSGILATPVRTVPRDMSDEQAPDIDEVAAIVADTAAVEVVVGLPRTLAGDEGPAAEQARQYARRLAVRVAPVAVRLAERAAHHG